jgi:uncharacterized phage-associated protein
MTDLISPSITADALLLESRDRGEILTNLKLQKLLYYSQAWHLAMYDKCLFDEDFQAWVHGPVLQSQYNRFKNFQWRPIVEEISQPIEICSKIITFISEIIDVFGTETAVALELMTHRERPWMEARGALPQEALSNTIISKNTMKTFYKSLLNNENN